MNRPFWGRREALERLERLAGVSGRVIVTGPRGIGKTCLVARWAQQRAAEGKGRPVILPAPSPATPATGIDPHLDGAVRRGVPETGQGVGWRDALAAALAGGAAGGVIVDGLEAYRHCLGPSGFAAFLADLQGLPGSVVATGVPSSSALADPGPWRELPLGPLSDDLVAELIERLWRSRGASLSEASRDLLAHLVAGSPLALAGWVRAAEEAASLEALDRASLLGLHAALLRDGMVGRWWARWWEALFPDAASRRAACAEATALLSVGGPVAPVAEPLGSALAAAGILVPTATGYAAVVDPQALAVLRLAQARAERGPDGEVAFLAAELQGWERARGLALPRAAAAAVAELLRSWAGISVDPAAVGAGAPLPPLPSMVALSSPPVAAPGDLPFLLLSGVAPDGPLGGRWRIAVATGAAPASAGEIASLVDTTEFLGRSRGSGGERLLIVSPPGFTGGAREAASRAGAWHVDLAGLNHLRAAAGLPPLAAPSGSSARLPRGPLEGQTVELSLPPAADVELVAAAAADCLAGMAGFGKEDRDRVRMAVVEGTINALEHGGDGRVRLVLAVTDDGISVTVRDFGPGVVAAPGEEAAGSPGRRRGWGTAVMRQLMDEVRVEPVAEGTKVVLVKRRPAGRG